MLRSVVLVAVHAEDQSDVLAFGRGRNDDLLHRPAQMFFRLVRVGELTGRFNHDLRAHGLPRNGRRVFLGEHADGLAIDGDGVGGGADVVLQVAENGIVLKQVGKGGRAGQIVDGDEFDVRIAEGGADDVASDAAEAIDANFDSHEKKLPPKKFAQPFSADEAPDLKQSL